VVVSSWRASSLKFPELGGGEGREGKKSSFEGYEWEVKYDRKIERGKVKYGQNTWGRGRDYCSLGRTGSAGYLASRSLISRVGGLMGSWLSLCYGRASVDLEMLGRVS